MTHEEIFATLGTELSSYRDLPQFWYQFQTKFRDEPRPKSGLLRVREFTMKDSYSFDVDEAGLDKSRSSCTAAPTSGSSPGSASRPSPVEASSGNMGGSDSVEFMCPAEAGEDIVVALPGLRLRGEPGEGHLGAAAGDRRSQRPGRPAAAATPRVRGPSRTCDRTTGCPADRQIKTLVQVIDGQLTLVLLRGDHPLSDQKLIDATGAAEIRPAQPGRDPRGARRAPRAASARSA